MTFNSYFVYNSIQDFVPNNFSMRRNRIQDNLSKTNYPFGNPERDLFANVLTSSDLVVPNSKIDHISISQNYSTGANFTSHNLTAPLILNSSSAAFTWTLPSASALLNIFGNVYVNMNILPISTANIAQVQVAQSTQSQNQIQLGDYFIIKVLSLGTAACTITAGKNGTIFSGTKTIPAYSAINEMYSLIIIQFTSINIYSPSYVVY